MDASAEQDPRKWVRLSDALRGDIARGALAPGQPIPSITSLQARLGYARETCAKALRALEREGLLRRYPGLGYYVNASR